MYLWVTGYTQAVAHVWLLTSQNKPNTQKNMQRIVFISTLLVDPRYEKVRYVGKTINLQNRYEQHLYWFDNSNPKKRSLG